MAKSKTLELDLLANAIDSITHGLDHYVKGTMDAVNYKYAILHVWQGIELILKERLRKEHWVLIYDKVEKPDKSRTIGFETAIERLNSICNVSLAKYMDGLRGLRDARHDIEHYKVSISEPEALALIGNNIPFLMGFLEDELGTTLKEQIKDVETWQELLLIETVFKKAITQANEEIQWVYREGDQDYPMRVECPVCDLEYLVIKSRQEKEAECLLCKHVAELKECMRCSKLFPVDEWFSSSSLCADCKAYVKEPYT